MHKEEKRGGIPASLLSAEEKTVFLESTLKASEYFDLIILKMQQKNPLIETGFFCYIFITENR
jgi:hypothetical protein